MLVLGKDIALNLYSEAHRESPAGTEAERRDIDEYLFLNRQFAKLHAMSSISQILMSSKYLLVFLQTACRYTEYSYGGYNIYIFD